MNPDALLATSLLIPVVAAGLIPLLSRWPNPREAITLLAGSLLILTVWTLAAQIQQGTSAELRLLEWAPGLEIRFAVEPLGMLFTLVAASLWLPTSLYAIGYLRTHGEHKQTRFYTCFALAIAATLGIALAGNLLTLFMFYEALTLVTVPLVTHAGTDAARCGGRTYLGLLLFTSIGFLLPAIIWTWELSGTLDFRPGGILPAGVPDSSLGFLLTLFLFGVGKAAMMPFHRWLPAAMVAPTPVSALLHAVAVVKAGAFTLLKLAVYIFGLERLAALPATDWLLGAAAASVLLASLTALQQDNLKARLAYSTISQLGYITLGALLATHAGITGGAFHIAAHGLGKITLFFCAGAVMIAIHKTQVSELDGIGRRMPLTMAAFLIGSLSIIGLPPAAGTWSKWYLMLGSLEAGHALIMAVLMLSSLLSIAYLIPIPLRAFFRPLPPGEDSGLSEAPLLSLAALLLTALGCLLLFLNPDPLVALLGPLFAP